MPKWIEIKKGVLNMAKTTNLPVTSQMVVEMIETHLQEQCDKGIHKYGQTIDQAKDQDYNWQGMAMEELIDGIQYLMKENKRLNDEITLSFFGTPNKIYDILRREYHLCVKYDLQELQPGLYHAKELIDKLLNGDIY